MASPNYVLQEKDLTRDKLASAYGLAIIVGWTIAFFLHLISGTVASYYNEPGLVNLLRVLALNFVLIPIGIVTPALLKRKMDFTSLLYIRLMGSLVNATTSITLGLAGFGYMCMAWGSLAGISASALGCLYFMPREYRTFPALKE